MGHRPRGRFVEEGGRGGGGKRDRPSPARTQNAPGATRGTSDDPTVDRVSSSRRSSPSSDGVRVSGRCALVLYRADVTEGGMPATTVVEGFDVVEDRIARLAATDVVVSVDELRLERREEALRHRVVPAIALAAHAGDDSPFAEPAPVVLARVLDTAVRVMDEASLGAPGPESHAQGVEGERPVEVRIHGPADNTPREQVQDGREVGPALSGPDVGDVGHPDLVGRRGREVPVELIRRDRMRVPRVGRHTEGPLSLALETFLSHQARHALTPDLLAIGLEILVDARTPVGLAARSVRRSNLDFERGIFLSPETQTASAPGVEARGRDQERPAQHSHGVRRLLRLDEPELHWLSFTKKAAAFFSISRSIRSCRASRRSATSSARSAVVNAPAPPPPASTPDCFTHCRTAVSVRSRSRETCPIVLPPSRTSSTTSALYSAVNFRRARFSMGTPRRIFASSKVSTKSGEVQHLARERPVGDVAPKRRNSLSGQRHKQPRLVPAAAMLAEDYLAAAAVHLADRTFAVCFMPRLSEAQPFGVEANRPRYIGDEKDGARVPDVCDLLLGRS